MNYIFSLIIIFATLDGFSQKIEEEYYGKFNKSNDINTFDNVKLRLYKNGKFTFSYINIAAI